MRILLDTNIIIYRESTVGDPEIGTMFYWIDRLHHDKFIDPASLEEVRKYGNAEVLRKLNVKLESYNILKTRAHMSKEIQTISNRLDRNDNDKIDSLILNELFCGRADWLISNDKFLLEKAKLANLSDKVFTVKSFLEKIRSENPDFVDYKVLSIKKELFGNIDLMDPFFDSLKNEYRSFEGWFKRKSNEYAYICKASERVMGFLFLKKEDEEEKDYLKMTPILPKARRLKIGTLKVELHDVKMGERFLKIAFDNALKLKVKEIYVTFFNDNTEGKKRLISILEEWGFYRWGTKTTDDGIEDVYVKKLDKRIDVNHPKKTFPFFSEKANMFIVPIFPKFHTNLLPDSFLKTESPEDFIEIQPFKFAINKVYVSRSIERGLQPGDVILFYRTGEGGPAYYTSVATTVGIVDSVITDIKDEEQFRFLCGNRSVFSEEELSEQWNKSPYKPFVVNFLYAFPIPLGKKPNLERLLDLGIIKRAPRGFEKINKEAFINFLKEAGLDENITFD